MREYPTNRLWCVAIAVALVPSAEADDVTIGERPAIEHHVDQADIDARRLRFDQIFSLGETLFTARFNSLDGEGRPASTGAGTSRQPGQPAFIRTSAPDSNACAGCHNLPHVGGAGDFVANVFVLAQTLDPVTFSVGPESSDERNTLGMNGSGAIELLAREMSAALIETRERAKSLAAKTGSPTRLLLTANGVRFGAVTVLPDGRVDPSEIVGVDWDLVVKPFHQKGAVVSLREFTNNAMNHHHGMQSVERFGAGTDPDQDGVTNELTVGDITATTLYQAALPIPVQRLPRQPERLAAVFEGRKVFNAVGCSSCHIPQMVLRSRIFTEPNPYNPVGNLRPADVAAPYALDLTRDGPRPQLEPWGRDGAIVRAFTDLKRHDLCDADYDFFCNERVPQGSLRGNAPATDFTIAAPPRPTSQFLTRKLWDAGSSDPYGHRGDLTTMTEAINYHGGEARASRDAFFDLEQEQRDAVIEFLKSLQVL